MGSGEHVDAHVSSTDGGAPRIDGETDAPLVVMHADLSCPDCALAMERLRRIPLRIDLRHFVLRARGVPALRAALAAEAAAQQGAFWPFARDLLAHQGRQEVPDLWALCAAHGLDVDQFEADRRAEVGVARVRAETTDALRRGAAQVPGVFANAEVAAYLALHGYSGPVVVTGAVA